MSCITYTREGCDNERCDRLVRRDRLWSMSSDYYTGEGADMTLCPECYREAMGDYPISEDDWSIVGYETLRRRMADFQAGDMTHRELAAAICIWQRENGFGECEV